MTTLPPTSTKGGHRILAQLGQGGMARIQLALRQGPGGFRKLFVIKEMRSECATDSHASLFLHEARLAALLSHPNVVQAHLVGQELDNCYLEMEYLEGQSLARLVRRVDRDNLPLETHLYILTELLAGLAHAHQLRNLSGLPLHVVHRDVSPGNVFLTYDGQVKLLDFGIAKSIELTDLPSLGSIKGKVGYMSPEQALANHVDHRSDLYSVGVMLWEAIACQPFVPRGEATEQSMAKRRAGYVPSLLSLCPEIEPELLEICQRALALDPKDRYQAARALREDLLEQIGRMTLRPSRESLATLVQRVFAQERKELDAVIAEKIASDESPRDTPLSQSLFRGSGVSSAPGLPKAAPAIIEEHFIPEPKSQKMRNIGIAATALVLGVGVGTLAFRDAEPTKREVATPAAPQAASVVSPRPAPPVKKAAEAKPAPVHFSLRVTPSNAQIILDGQRIGKGQIEKLYPNNAARHHLKLRAPGYQPVERIVVFDRDQSLEISLAPRPRGSRDRKQHKASRPIRRPKTEAPPAQAPAKALPVEKPRPQPPITPKLQAGDDIRKLGKSRTRKIDKENPYQ